MPRQRTNLLLIAFGAAALSLLAALAVDELGDQARELSILGGVAFAKHGRGWDSQMPVKNEETIRKSFTFSAAEGPKTLEIDNVFGSIEVAATSSNEAQLVIAKTLNAESEERLEAARKEVTLDVSQNGNHVRLYVNGPFRCRCSGDCTGTRDHPGYRVKMDFRLQIPGEIDLKLKTVNEGDIRVTGVAGNYALRNVNGSIGMTDVAGSGIARTVNGSVTVSFRENPRANSEFSSLNGGVELYFAKNLSADFRFKTLNGHVYTDYPLTALPPRAPLEERRNGKLVFRTDGYTGGRVGAGGPEIKLENLNGDIRVLERHS